MKSEAIKDFFTNLTERVSLPVLAVVCSLLITFILLPFGVRTVPNLKVRDISPVDVRSPANLIVEDEKATEEKVKSALTELKPVFKVNPQAFFNIKEDILKTFYLNGDRETSNKTISLAKPEFIINLLERYYSTGVIYDETAKRFKGKTVKVVNPLTSTSTYKEISAFYTVSQVKKRIEKELRSFYGGKKGSKVYSLIEHLITPNISYSDKATLEEKQQIVNQVKPVLYQIKKGEIVVKKGTKLNFEDVRKIEAIEKLKTGNKTLNRYFAIFFVSLLMFYIVYKLYFIVSPTAAKSIKNITFSYVLITLDVFLIRFFTFFVKLMTEAMNIPVNEGLIYVPVITSVIFVSLFLNKKVAFIHSIPVAVIPSFLLAKPHFFIIPVLAGSVFSCMDSQNYQDKNAIYKSSFYAGLGVAVFQLLLLIYTVGFDFKKEFLAYPIFSILGSLIASIIVIGLLPFFGSAFRFTTDMVYMELINLNHPLLRKLVLKAPGTYSHSVMVSTLAEAAAETIGANSLLAKAGGLFHDIGKLKNPQAFVENQQNGINVHDTLPYEKSAVILKSHVEYGVELGEKHNLPEPIIDIIKQHHGTKLMKYFYMKAKEQNSEVDEKIFRYPGPKPKFREAGIVMLADTVEAAVKSVKDKKDVDIDKLIHKLIIEDVEDGQLTQSGLTLKDISLIEKVFKKVLSGVYHNRIEYPDRSSSKKPENS